VTPVLVTFACGGCDATTRGTAPLRKRFVGINGCDYGLGTYHVDQVAPLAPDGWMVFDPYTMATYCPTCWAEIESDGDAA
jgi:hypothetical protein